MADCVKQALLRAVGQLTTHDGARRDAQVLLGFVLNKPREFLFTHPEYVLTTDEQSAYDALINKRRFGAPVAYLVGERAFWTLDLEVSPAVLIPRPETELLVELALALPLADAAWVVDLGTGSGAIALALASERRQWRLIATDNSEPALSVARRNAQKLGLANVELRLGEWCKALPANMRVDMIVSNPPYIDKADPHLQIGDLRFEPKTALVAQEQGFLDLRMICGQAASVLHPGGWLLLEHGYQQSEVVRHLLEQQEFTEICSKRDLGGHERVSLGRKPLALVREQEPGAPAENA